MTVRASFEDVSELSAALGPAFDIEICQLSKGRFAGELTSWPLSEVLVSHGFLKRSVQISGVTNRQVTLLVDEKAAGRRVILNGITLDSTDVLATPFRTEHRFVLPAGFHGVVLQLSHPLLGEHEFPPEQYLPRAEVLRDFALSVAKLEGVSERRVEWRWERDA